MKKTLEDRTIEIIEKGGRILLKDGIVYLHHWTNLAAGIDKASWTYNHSCALEFFTLDIAFAMAKCYSRKSHSCKVMVRYPKKKKVEPKAEKKPTLTQSTQRKPALTKRQVEAIRKSINKNRRMQVVLTEQAALSDLEIRRRIRGK